MPSTGQSCCLLVNNAFYKINLIFQKLLTYQFHIFFINVATSPRLF
jgi:hypothetical protein